jgi:hypothetical protein
MLGLPNWNMTYPQRCFMLKKTVTSVNKSCSVQVRNKICRVQIGNKKIFREHIWNKICSVKIRNKKLLFKAKNKICCAQITNKNLSCPNHKQKFVMSKSETIFFVNKSETESAAPNSETKICCVHIRNKNLSCPIQKQTRDVQMEKQKDRRCSHSWTKLWHTQFRNNIFHSRRLLVKEM